MCFLSWIYMQTLWNNVPELLFLLGKLENKMQMEHFFPSSTSCSLQNFSFHYNQERSEWLTQLLF